MVLDRLARGWRWAGRSHSRIWLTALMILPGLAVSAVASSGGSGLGSSSGSAPRPATAHPAQSNPLAGRGMWIWYVSRSNGGSISSIVARARLNGVSTVMIKSGDGTSYWSQFSPQLVGAFHAAGMKVCAWQFVYGSNPVGEANTGAAAVHNGADCLLIDAESQYEGKYVQAQTYLAKLRSLVGSSYPLALAGFPYVDYHPAFPYSVFLGPGGAQSNAPQMYWRDIGVSVDTVYSHTYAFNRMYQRPIFPLGEVVVDPPATPPPPRDIRRFRQLSRAYGAANVSWWMWQGLSATGWQALSQKIGTLRGFTPNSSDASLGSGARGDLVVWVQEHLVGAGQQVTIDGVFGPQTKAAVQRFQSARGLAPDGLIGTSTWQALLQYSSARVKWVIRKSKQVATIAGVHVEQVPASAHLRAQRYEIPRNLGAGAPPHR